jgi:hypothetical protein
MSNSNKFRSFEVSRIQIRSNLAKIGSPIFNSNLVPNLEELQSGTLFLIQLSTRSYFIWKILYKGREPFYRIIVDQLHKYLNKSIFFTVQLGRHTDSLPCPWSHRADHVAVVTVPLPPCCDACMRRVH